MARKVIDIETNNLLANMLDYSSLPYKLNNQAKLWCIVIRDIDTDEVTTLTSETGNTITKDQVKNALQGTTEIVAHNGIKFDFISLKLFGVLDYEVGYLEKPDLLFGNEIKITDTLIRSRLFNPDRYGGHSLDAWGKKLGEFKGVFKDFDKYSDEMLQYCIQDTKVTALIYKDLEVEWSSYDRWKKPEKLENKLADLAVKRETYGFWFDKDLAVKCLEDLTKKMEDLENNVNPILPPKPMNKTTLKKFTPPKNQFKKDGTPNAHILNFAEKHGAEIEGDLFIYKGKLLQLPLDKPIETHEVASISDLDHVKMHLINLGWNPTEFKVRDLTKDSKKQNLPYQKRVEALDRWLEQTFDDGKYTKNRLNELGLGKDKDVIRQKLLKRLSEDKPVRVPTSPMVRVGVEKELCPNLVKLGDKVAFANDFTLYLTYKHRKSSIAGGEIDDMDFDEEYPNTGFLSMYREVDGRVPTPAIEIGASTNRYRHIGVCNVARASSIYGKEMRSLFGCGKGMYQLGFDFSSLEARIQGHYILPFDGEELAEQLLASKPKDIHCYSEDTEILTLSGWKTFGELLPNEKVAQWNNGSVDFVVPSEIVWQDYEGDMYECSHSGYKVTPNHRVLYKSFSNGMVADYISRADEFRSSSDKRYVLAGTTSEEGLKMEGAFIKLLVAMQADGHFSKDCSAITFSFVKERKVARLSEILTDLGCKYTVNSSSRNGREEVVFRLNSSDLTNTVRHYLPSKSFSNELLKLSSQQMRLLVDEVKFWDGTLRANGDVVLDSTDSVSIDFIQTACSLIGLKAKVSEYTKKTSYGTCAVKRCYISYVSRGYTGTKPLAKVKYKGKIGCVSVPSGLVLVKRNGKIIVSGNTINANKLGISRDQAKSVSYALMYGASWTKLKTMLGLNDAEAKALFDAYWQAVKPLSDLKEAITKAWTKRDKVYVVGVDGRKINTRSQHSLLNALFQSGGVICAKYSTVFIYQILEEQGLRCDPFVNSELDMCGMIEYHK